jgi:hypothetical protein
MSSLIYGDTKVLNVGKAGAEKSLTPNDTDDTKSRIGDEYVLIRKSAVKPVDSKESNPACSAFIKAQAVGDPTRDMKLSDPSEMLRSTRSKSILKAAMSSKSGNGPVVTAKLFQTGSVTSGAGAAIAGWFGLTPSSSAEWASYATLYDEAKVERVEVDYGAIQSSISANPFVSYAIGYDPTYNTIPASVRDVRESSQSQWGLQASPTIVGGLNSTVTVGGASATGTRHFHAKMPSTPALVDPANTTNNFPGSWMATGDTADSIGYLRYYFTAPGGTNLTIFSYLITYTVKFRIRT